MHHGTSPVRDELFRSLYSDVSEADAAAALAPMVAREPRRPA
jgi:hypothetical protein